MAKKDPKADKKAKKASGRHKSSSRESRVEEPPFVAADDPAAELLDVAVKSTPWWALSLAFHGLILACLPLIIFSQRLVDRQMSEIHITIPPPKKTIEISPTDLRTPMAHGGIPDNNVQQPEDKSIIFPGAEISDHIETADGEDYNQAKGQSLDATSYIQGADDGLMGRKPGAGAGTNESIGVGGGSGSGKKYGGAYGGRFNRNTKGHLVSRSDSAVEAGLRWLARHQSPDGHWSARDFHAQCMNGECSGIGLGDYDMGVTGLALLSYLGAGYTQQQRAAYIDPVTKKTVRFGDVVGKGLKWVLEHQNQDGALGPLVGQMMYNHAIGTLALCEAYGLTNALPYRTPAQKAIGYLCQAQNYQLGWRYTARCNQNDTSVTGWCVMALKSAQLSNLEVPQIAFQGAKAWIERVTDANNGRTGYIKLGDGQTIIPGKNDKFADHPAMTAVGVLCRIFIDKKKGDKALVDGTKLILQDIPRWDPNGAAPSVDSYYWYYGTLAVFQNEGPESKGWERWNKAVTDILCGHQRTSKDGCLDGSWDPEVDRWACEGGRCATTALDILTLETSYRYESAFGSAKRGAEPPK